MEISKKTGMSLLIYILINILIVNNNKISFITCALLSLLFMKLYYKDITIKKEKTKFKDIIIYGFIILGLTSLGSVISNFINYLLSFSGFHFTGENLKAFELKNIHDGIIMSVYSIIIAPIVEELVFRGFILENLKQYSSKAAIIISSLIFGLLHMEYFQFIPAIISGIILGCLYIKYNSIWLVIGAHVFNNIIVLALMQFNLDLGYLFIVIGLLLLYNKKDLFKIKDKKNNEFKYSHILKSLSCMTFIIISLIIMFVSFKAI